MKDSYDFNKMRKVPHPLLDRAGELTDNVGSISDEDFELKLQDLEPDERDIAIRLRKRRRLNTDVQLQK